MLKVVVMLYVRLLNRLKIGSYRSDYLVRLNAVGN